MSKSPSAFERYILNCDASERTEDDWTIDDSRFEFPEEPPLQLNWNDLDIKENQWWAIDDQEETGACVGYATARGVLRWHYKTTGLIRAEHVPSARFIWMANKETDELTGRPTTFLDKAGTQTKLALRVAQKYGCVLEGLLPMDGRLSSMDPGAFYCEAAKLRIHSYHKLGTDISKWKRWIAFRGPLLARAKVDQTWYYAGETGGHLDDTSRDLVSLGGHAVCIVGYTPEYFIFRNSWGEDWGDRGFGYATNAYIKAAFTEAYGVTMDGDGKIPAGGGGAP
jgi:hypothetical protein